jgi:hypothetical protein
MPATELNTCVNTGPKVLNSQLASDHIVPQGLDDRSDCVDRVAAHGDQVTEQRGQVSVPQLSQAGDQTCQDWVNDLRPKPLNNVAHILHDFTERGKNRGDVRCPGFVPGSCKVKPYLLYKVKRRDNPCVDRIRQHIGQRA